MSGHTHNRSHTMTCFHYQNSFDNHVESNLHGNMSGVPIKKKREIAAKNDFYFATYVPHTISMSSLKRKSQCH